MSNRRVVAAGDDALAVMSFPEIGQQLGISSASARVTYGRAMKKLRANTAALEEMQGLADELDRKWPVDVDWFGGGGFGGDTDGSL